MTLKRSDQDSAFVAVTVQAPPVLPPVFPPVLPPVSPPVDVPVGATARPVEAEMCPVHRLRDARSCRMPGSACTVAAGQSCMRMV